MTATGTERKRLIDRLAGWLAERHPMRAQMFGIVVAAALVGFITTFGLHELGVASMPLRYFVATILGYLSFVGLVRLWLVGLDASSHFTSHGSGNRRSSGINFNPLGRIGGRAASDVGETLFKGGRSGGAGASASFDSPTVPMALAGPPPGAGSSSSPLPFDVDKVKVKGKGAAVIIVLVGLGILIYVCGRVVFDSPHLVAEMLVDGAVAGTALGGIRRLRDRRSVNVIAHTWKPALIILITVVAVGALVQHYVPSADSVGDLFR